MCGIAYIHNKTAKNVIRPVLKRFDKQRSRGTEGFGFVGFNVESRCLISYIRSETEVSIRASLEKLRVEDKAINGLLFHHRRPTSTANIAECAHPIPVRNDELEYQYFVVHNGMISNADERKKEHEKLGYSYVTAVKREEKIVTADGKEYLLDSEDQFNDSEALAIDLVRVIEGKAEKVEAKGSIAFIVLQSTRDGHAKAVYYGRNFHNPLHK
jgi:glucosamine 6-phosphate synthetase-like amidotransferase/phosphosugar isomerase protein